MSSPYQDLSILVVEDNDSILFFMEAALTQLGVGRVLKAKTWFDVQSVIEGQQIDGAFLDLVLQHGSGLDVGRSMRALKVPVIFCSGVTDEYNHKQMYELGFVFSKPIGLAMLVRGLEYFAGLKRCGGKQ
jgi:DNA-binding response OmpR family regulator